MTHSRDELLKQLRVRGARLTIQRRLVLDILLDGNDHLSVQDIQAQVTQRGADLTETTVYRILQWLKNLGFVSQTDLGQRGVVYELIGSPRHHHLICLNCGGVIEVGDGLFEELRDHVRRDYDFEPRIDHMAIFGLCQDCGNQNISGE
ncbi:MAG: transcriptional repressor [Anaerolineae bacterium]|nr:transcriptional repressor [Anaerolineae bacterium]